MVIEISQDTLEDFGDVQKTLQHIIDVIEARYASAGVPLPSRAYTAVGDVGSSIALDCEQFTVNFVQAYLGLPGQPDLQPKGCLRVMSGDFVVQVTRCIPTPTTTSRGVKPPAVEKIEASTVVQAVDAQILLESAYELSSLEGVSATVAASGVSGEYQSMMLNVSVSLFGDDR